MKELLRQLPSVDEILKEERAKAWMETHPRVLVLEAVRTAIDRQRKAILRAGDADATTTVAVYRDRGADTIVRITWHSKSGREEVKTEVLESGYLYLTPPDLTKSASGGLP